MDGTLYFPSAAAPAPGSVETIAPGVKWLRMPLPFALDHINLWLLDDGAGWTIVDCGYAGEKTRALWEEVFANHLDGRPVTRIIATHYHPDHIGLAAWLTARWRAPLWTTEKEWLSARVNSGDSEDLAQARRDFALAAGLDAEASSVYESRHQGYRRGVPAVPAAFRRIADGTTIEIGGRRWRVVVGEGHAPELACLYCAETGILISSDQVLPVISPNVSVGPSEPEGDPLARYLASLDRLRGAVPPEVLVLPSHKLPFRGLHVRIEELAAHHAARVEETLAACDAPRSALDLVPVLFRRRLDPHQTAFALGEALAHLHYLWGRGALDRITGADGVHRFIRKAA